MLLAATIVALLWANLGGHSYEHFWHTHFSIHLGDVFSVDMSLQHWINDGLMMMFFFLFSLEVKHDFVMGELREWRRASVPVTAWTIPGRSGQDRDRTRWAAESGCAVE